jgi:hypothetical protein
VHARRVGRLRALGLFHPGVGRVGPLQLLPSANARVSRRAASACAPPSVRRPCGHPAIGRNAWLGCGAGLLTAAATGSCCWQHCLKLALSLCWQHCLKLALSLCWQHCLKLALSLCWQHCLKMLALGQASSAGRGYLPGARRRRVQECRQVGPDRGRGWWARAPAATASRAASQVSCCLQARPLPCEAPMAECRPPIHPPTHTHTHLPARPASHVRASAHGTMHERKGSPAPSGAARARHPATHHVRTPCTLLRVKRGAREEQALAVSNALGQTPAGRSKSKGVSLSISTPLRAARIRSSRPSSPSHTHSPFVR